MLNIIFIATYTMNGGGKFSLPIIFRINQNKATSKKERKGILVIDEIMQEPSA